MSSKLAKFIIAALVFISCSVQAESVTENFSSTSFRYSSQMVWNLAAEELHPPIVVYGWNDGGGATDTLLDVGDGRHGSFNSTTYADFSENGDVSGQVIRLNTEDFPDLQVTDFHLEAGWTLRPTGNSPLVIRSQSSITVDGIVDCSGEDGADLNADDSQAAAGGLGHCGGGDGGAGGSVGTAATDGSAGGSNVGGGASGGAGGHGGGGGGAYSQPATSATAGAGASGGFAGANFQDDGFREQGGGSGGGGGGVSDTGALGDSSGGGGGAGGGIIEFYAVGNIDISGSVLADGGNGGGAAGQGNGGGGGGGGGGSISMFSAQSVTIGGTVRAQKGLGAVTDGNSGGDGAVGRTWITDDSGGSSGNFENPAPFILSMGTVEYGEGDYQVVSGVFDTQSSQPTFSGASLSVTIPTGASADVDLVSSDSQDVGLTGWIEIGSLSEPVERYVRYRLRISSPDRSQPVRLDSLALNYTPFRKNEFDFEGSCGTTAFLPPEEQPPFWLGLYLFPFLLVLVLRLTRRTLLPIQYGSR